MIDRPHTSYTRTADERRTRPRNIRRLRFDDLIQSRDGPGLNVLAAGSNIVPIEAAQPGDTQVLAAAEPRTDPGRPVVALDSLAGLPSIDSVVMSTEVSLATPLHGVRELLLQDGRAPMPDSAVFAALPRLEALHAVSAHRSRMLELRWLAGLPLTDLAVSWNVLKAGDLASIDVFATLRRLMVNAGPAEPVGSIGRLSRLTYLHLRGGRSGWTGLNALESLEEAYFFETGLADLRLAQGWSSLRALGVLGPRLKSLAGVEALRALEWLSLTNVGVTDLAAMRGLPALAVLRLAALQVEDLAPLADLPSLRELTLEQPIGARPWRIESLAPLAALPQLESVQLRWVTIADRDLSALERLPSLKRLEVLMEGDPDGQLRGFRRARPDVEIEVSGGGSPGIAVGTVQIHPPSADVPEWWIFQDLTGDLATPTNFDAEARLKNALEERNPDLLTRLTFDSEAGGVGVSAHAEADIREVARLIGELAGTAGR